jgi:hypothetical protein
MGGVTLLDAIVRIDALNNTLNLDEVMHMLSLTVEDWSAWIPETEIYNALQQLSQHQGKMQTSQTPNISNIPAMIRRRLSTIGKSVVSTSLSLLSEKTNTPCVFSSRHGDLGRTISLLTELSNKTPLSPTHFSLSVHNSISGILSIMRKDTNSITALATNNNDIGTVFLEATGILKEQACKRVLCVIYDAPPIYPYNDTCKHPNQAYAIAFLLSSSNKKGSTFMFSICDTPGQYNQESFVSDEPDAIQFLRFMLSPQTPHLLLAGPRNAWQWSRR